MLPYKLPEHEAFHPASFSTSDWWQSSSWCRNSPPPLPPVTLQEHHHNFHHSHSSHRSFFCKGDTQQTQLPTDPDSSHLEGISYLSSGGDGTVESGLPKWESDEVCHGGATTTPTSAPIPTSSAPTSGKRGGDTGDAFWSSTLSRVAAVAAAAMACAAVPQKNTRDGCAEFEEAPLGVDESEKLEVKEPWCRNQRKLHSRR